MDAERDNKEAKAQKELRHTYSDVKKSIKRVDELIGNIEGAGYYTLVVEHARLVNNRARLCLTLTGKAEALDNLNEL